MLENLNVRLYNFLTMKDPNNVVNESAFVLVFILPKWKFYSTN